MLGGAGQRNRKVEFLRSGIITSGRGAKAPGEPEVIGKTRAAVNYGKGSERREAGTDSASFSATLRVLKTSATRSLTGADQVRMDGAIWDISSIVPWGMGELDITATRRV